MKVVAFVPMKLSNERLPGKNTKKLGGIRPLYLNILDALLNVESISETFVYCSAEEFPHLPAGVSYLRRSEQLDQSSTRINEVMTAFATDVPADVYVLAHATAPFLTSQSIEKVVARVVGGQHDSALTVRPLQEFVWEGGVPVNYDPASIPRTQDLPPIHVETSGAYAFRAELVSAGRRVGHSPALVEVSKREAIDVNDWEDWDIADAIFRSQFEAGAAESR